MQLVTQRLRNDSVCVLHERGGGREIGRRERERERERERRGRESHVLTKAWTEIFEQSHTETARLEPQLFTAHL